MTMDSRATLLVCQADDCRFACMMVPEPTCNLKLVVVGEGGKCTMYEKRKQP